MRVLDTRRLHMRPLGAADEALYCRIYTDAGLMRHIGTPLSADTAQRSFCAARRESTHRSKWWVMVETASRTDIGLLGLVIQDEDAQIGAMVLEPWQSGGYAAEAIAALVEHAFQDLGLNSLHTRHSADNGAAAGLMRKLGFVQVATLSNDMSCRWQLLPAHWTAR